MSFLSELKAKAGEAYKFFQQNQSPAMFVANKFGPTITQAGQQLQQRFSPPVQPGQAQFSDILRPAYKIGSAITQAEQQLGRDLGYYAMPQNVRFQTQAQLDQLQAQRAIEEQTNQATLARQTLQKTPYTPNRNALLSILQQSGGGDANSFIPEGVSTRPGQIVANAAETALDVATAGTMSAGMKKAITNVPRLARYAGAGAGLGAGYGGIEALRKDMNVTDAMKTIGLYGAGGTVAGLGLFGVGKLANKFATKSKLPSKLLGVTDDLTENAQPEKVGSLLDQYGDDVQIPRTPAEARQALSGLVGQTQNISDASRLFPNSGLLDESIPTKAELFSDDLAQLGTQADNVDDATRLFQHSGILNTPGSKADKAAKARIALEGLPEQVNNVEDATKLFPHSNLFAKKVGKEVMGESTQESTKLFERISKGFNRSETGDDLLKRIVASSNYEKQTISWEETRQAAEAIGLDPSALSKKAADKLTRPEVLAIKDIVQTNVDFIINSEAKIKSGTLNPSDVAILQQKMETAMGQNIQLSDKLLPAMSEGGRFLNSLKIIANRSLDPASWLARAQKISGKSLTDAQHSAIIGFIQNSDRIGLVDYIGTLRKSSLGEKGVTLWKAGLLTNPTSHMKNIAGNTIMSTMESVKDVPATIVDWGIGKVTGKRTKAIAPILKGKAGAEGMEIGAERALNYIKTGIDPEDLMTKWDIPKQVQFDNPIVQGYVDGVFRLLGAEDKVFRYRMVQRSLMEDAIVNANQLLKNGDIEKSALKETIQQIYKAPTDDMARNAINAADYVTFQSDNVFSDMASSVKRAAGDYRPVAEFIMPFTKTPSNVVKTISDYSPVGVAQVLVKQVRKGFNQKELAEAIGRGITGSGIIALGTALAASGKLTGSRSEDERTNNLQDVTGELSSAVKIGDTWVQINQFAPMGNLLVLGADLYTSYTQSLEEGKTKGAALQTVGATAGLGMLKQVVDQPFLQGVSGALGALTDRERKAESFITRSVSSVVPSFISALARGVDPELKDPKGSLVDKVVQQVMSKVPGLSQKVPGRPDIFGREKAILGTTTETKDQRTGMQITGDVLQALFSPIISQKESKNPVVQELKKINYATPIPEKTTLSFDGVEGKLTLSPERQQQYTQVTGANFYNFMKVMIQTPEWQQSTDEDKILIVDELYKEAREAGDLYLQFEYLKKKMQGASNTSSQPSTPEIPQGLEFLAQ